MHEPVVAALGRTAQEANHRDQEPRLRPKSGEAERVDQDQGAKPLAMAARVPGGDRAAEHVSDQDRRRACAAGDQLVDPGQHPFGVERRTARGRGAVLGQVGRDHVVAGDERRHRPQPLGSELARPVQEHQRRPLAPFEHCGAHPGQLQPALGHRHTLEQPRSRLLALRRSRRCAVCHLLIGRRDLRCHPRRPFRSAHTVGRLRRYGAHGRGASPEPSNRAESSDGHF